jgi:hypothetical protein
MESDPDHAIFVIGFQGASKKQNHTDPPDPDSDPDPQPKP